MGSIIGLSVLQYTRLSTLSNNSMGTDRPSSISHLYSESCYIPVLTTICFTFYMGLRSPTERGYIWGLSSLLQKALGVPAAVYGVWRSSVCLSVCPVWTTVTHQGAACDAASVHFGLTINRQTR